MTEKQTKIHEQCLKLLNKFIEVCDKHNLNWFLDGGSLLGAVRDGGMIEWDDDIDVVMPRKDYNYLIMNCQTDFDEPFFLQTPQTDKYFEVHAKIRLDNTTSLTQRECTGMHHRGMFLDIFPLDNVADYEQAKALCGFVKTIGKYSSVKYAGDKMSTSFLQENKIFDYMNCILEDISETNRNSEYIADVVFYRYMDIDKPLPVFSKEDYKGYLLVPFKGLDKTVRIPVGYDDILTQWYGASWSIPKQQQSCHNSFVDPDTSYFEYNCDTKEDFEKLLKNNQI